MPLLLQAQEFLTRVRERFSGGLTPAIEREERSLVNAVTQADSLVAQYKTLPNPDIVLAQFGTYEGLGLYTRMYRQVGYVGGTAKVWTDATAALPFAIVAGDPDEGESRRIRDAMAAAYEQIEKRSVHDRQSLNGRFWGFAPGIQVWKRVEYGPAEGIIAPLQVMDLEPEDVQFSKDRIPLLTNATLANVYGSREIMPGDYIGLRWGSNRTPYGRGEFQDIYNDVWKYDLIQKMILEQWETTGRPILHFVYPNGWTKEALLLNLGNLKAAGWKVVVPIPAEVVVPEYSFPNRDAVVGDAGEGGFKHLRRLETAIGLNIIGVDFDQGGEGGNRAKMNAQISTLFDKTGPGGEALDEMWNEYWFRPACAVNFPAANPAWWCKRVTDSLASEDVLTRLQVAIQMHGINWPLSRKQMATDFGLIWSEDADDIVPPKVPVPAAFGAMLPQPVDENGDVVLMSEDGESIGSATKREIAAFVESKRAAGQ